MSDEFNAVDWTIYSWKWIMVGVPQVKMHDDEQDDAVPRVVTSPCYGQVGHGKFECLIEVKGPLQFVGTKTSCPRMQGELLQKVGNHAQRILLQDLET